MKVLPKNAIDENERERFLREISVLKILDHPNIVRLYETYSDSKRYYLVTEYYERCRCKIDCAQAANCLIVWPRKRHFQNAMHHRL